MLFLRKTGVDRWAVADLAVGKFSLVSDGRQQLLLRDADAIVGWDSQLKPFVDRPRDEARFLTFIRETAAGRSDAAEDYFVSGSTLHVRSQAFTPQPTIAPYSATSYTVNISLPVGSSMRVPRPIIW